MPARGALLVLLVVLALAPAAAAAELRTFELPSRLVDNSAPGGRLADGRSTPKVNVLLPDGYNARSKRRYPVLWLLHGATGGADTWTRSTQTIAAGLPAIVVMPDGGRFGIYTDWWNGGLRGNPAWATYHLRLLLRTIERRYPIRPGRRWHAVAGMSMGGQGTLRYAAMLPGYFGAAAGFSAAFPDMQSPEAQRGIARIPLAGQEEGVSYEAVFGPPEGPYAEGNSPRALVSNYRHTRLYLTSGDGVNCPQDPANPDTFGADSALESEINAQQGPFAAAARGAGAEVTDVTTCGVHTAGVWDRAFVAARAWGFFKPVPQRPRSWKYRTIATAGEMWGLRFRFATPPPRVVVFERRGRTLAASGSGTVRIRGRRGCRLRVELPFERRLPRACRR